jgi:uncharacterized protein
MKNNRRDFLKKSGLAGLGIAGAGFVSACSSDSNRGNTGTAENINWELDPEWQRVRYGDWGGPGVSAGPGPMDAILLKDYAPKSSVIVPETFVPSAKYPVIDVHIHNYPERSEVNDPNDALAEWVKTMDEVGVETSVVLTGATGEEFDRLVEMYLVPYPDRFQLYCGMERSGIADSNYSERAVEELERCYEKGARGVGEITDKGLGLTRDPNLPRSERLHFDDERADPFWEKCADLNLPVNIHVADHPSAWEPLDVFQERTPAYQHFNLHGDDIMSVEELLSSRDRMLEKHPDTTFIACHLSNQGNDLASLSDALDRYSNLYLDISARDYEVGRTPRAAKKFLTDYPDRVLFGTDMGMQKSMYQAWWRLLETADEYMVGRVWWQYYGLELSEPVLESLYYSNARRIMNWDEV